MIQDDLFALDEAQKALQKLEEDNIKIVSNDDLKKEFDSTDIFNENNNQLDENILREDEDDGEEGMSMLGNNYPKKNYSLYTNILNNDDSSSDEEREEENYQELQEGFRPGDDFDENEDDEDNEEKKDDEKYLEIIDDEFTDFVGFVEELDPVFPPAQPSIYNFLKEEEELKKYSEEEKKKINKEFSRLPPSIPPLSKGKI